ncbi:MAG: hypothetical protein SFW36_16245 [Leptolyngbyaceae cyanobacterium bins.59]|nr:hypothetical protein [Leptolyngbyaceae cyanobacterium bins.59]
MSIQNRKFNMVANLAAIVGAGALLSLPTAAFSAPSEHLIAQTGGSTNPADITPSPSPADAPREGGDATQNTPSNSNTLPGSGSQNDINQTSPSLTNPDPNRTRVSPNTDPNTSPANVNTNDGTYQNNPSGTPSNSNMNMDMNQGGSSVEQRTNTTNQQRTNTTNQQRVNTTNQRPTNTGTYNNQSTDTNNSGSTSTQQNTGGVRALW